MPTTFTHFEVADIRFPTSRSLDGSDAMNAAPDYSAAYVIIHTNRPDGLTGHGLTFTIGRGNEVCCQAIRALMHLVLGQTLEDFAAQPGKFWRRLAGDSQLRWIGPEKGAIHLALAAIINAIWDLYAKVEGKPLWRLLSEMTPEQIIACVDWRYLTDALTPEEALDDLKIVAETRAERTQEMLRSGYPAYTTSAGWLGYSDEKVGNLAREAMAAGWTHFKMKVGADVEGDMRRAGLIREIIGPANTLMMDANQTWEVNEAIERMRGLAKFNPWWIEEPTSPDDILGHAAIARALAPLKIGVATGEHGMNRVLFKQLLQAKAISFCQIDSCRLGGVNEVIAVLLLAKKFNIPVCPHAGGVGLCEYVQHLSMFDYVAVSGSLQNRVIEYVDHLHEHFVDPVKISRGRYLAPSKPGYSIEMFPESRSKFAFPGGPAWLRAKDPS
jgi:L-fuconate dehydratase